MECPDCGKMLRNNYCHGCGYESPVKTSRVQVCHMCGAPGPIMCDECAKTWERKLAKDLERIREAAKVPF